jgi:hypothetical protein
MPEGWLETVIIVQEEELLIEFRNLVFVVPNWSPIKLLPHFSFDR